MKIWKQLQSIMPDWLSTKSNVSEPENQADDHLTLARDSLLDLLHDKRVPEQVRTALKEDYKEIESMLDRLQQGHIQIAVFGRVSVGKSAMLNALLGEYRFNTSPLHGETKNANSGLWQSIDEGGVYLVDTPGINEVDGETRERLAREVASRSDLVLFVVDSDMTEIERQALLELAEQKRPIILILNKIDRFSRQEREELFDSLKRHTEGIIDPRNILGASADPAEQTVIRMDDAGNEIVTTRQPQADVATLKAHLWDIIEAEGKTLAALNASLFAGQLSDQVAVKILKVKRKLGEKLIRNYCISKGVAVAFNPIPVTDLIAAAVVDVTMIIHLSRLYGLPLTKNEAGSLVKTIGGQMILLMGTVWAVNFASSALKLGSAGFSTLVTGSAQGVVAYYSTYIVGQAAEHYLAHGKSWGDYGPKLVIKEILDNLDRGSILQQAKIDLRVRLNENL